MNNEVYLYKKISNFQNKYNIGYNFSIRRLIKNLNIHIVPYSAEGYLELLKISEDGFSVSKNGRYYIFYNPFQITTRQNFTLAHELGHIILGHHKLVGKECLAYKNHNNMIERQANIFARNALMPAHETKEMLKVKSYRELIDYYEVSRQMFKRRMKNLNYDLQWLDYVK